MREPVFTETLQVGIVVRDLESTMRTYVDDYGIGPWKIYEFNPENAKDLHEYGQPVERSWRLAVTTVGQVQWELIQPLDDDSIYARFLAERAAASTISPSLLRGSRRRWRRRPKRGTSWFSAASSAGSASPTSPRTASSARSLRSSAARLATPT
jgi:hypothetical protein